MYKCEHFRIEELIPPKEYLPQQLRTAYTADPNSVFRAFPFGLLVTLDLLRVRYGQATVNNWFWMDPTSYGEPHCRKWSGYRPESCYIGATLSDHRFFRAADVVFRSVVPAEIWADMATNPNRPEFTHIERVEAFEGMSWLHFDLGQHNRNGEAIRVFTVKGDRADLPEYLMR